MAADRDDSAPAPWGPHAGPRGPWDTTPAETPTETPPDTPPPAPEEPLPPPMPPVRLRSTDFYAAQRVNRRNTVWLVAILLLLGAVFGYLIGLTLDAVGADPQLFDPLTPSGPGFIGAAIFCGIGVVASAVTFMAGDRVMVGMTGAHDVTPEEEPVLHNVVEEMAIASGMPKPRVVVIETDALNAFATGMRPERSALGVTRGLLRTLNRTELQGVVGHEMGHIANMDTRYMTAVGILVGLIALVSDAILNTLRFAIYGVGVGGGLGGGVGGGRRGGRGRGNAAALVLVLILVVFAIVAPIAAALVRFAVSRQREYLADATSVRFTRNPAGLISALRKLGAAAESFHGANRATQHMFIINPFRKFSDASSALTSTHPSLDSRIERLENLGAG